ncbi:LytR/AlgR family response regulator transcription factor [Sphingobacterium lumbrici]|uniref:LytR/AlgR family response regulator transcription factor n=1 Tax=Sphingobacterium lumbrici TaxID=2559600 RepID=UPI001126B8B5|nr:LytTR family DNA-binding domain-containing protein [Sphingobacterium lumbrici]
MVKDVYTIMILDDDLSSTKLLQRMLLRIPYVDVVHEVNDPEEALKLHHVDPVDILFLDMEMPTMMGWEFAQLLDNPPVILVFTGHGQYGFEFQKIKAKAYINKLFSWDELNYAITVAIKEVDEREEAKRNLNTMIPIRNFKTKRRQVIELADLEYVSVNDNIVSLYFKDKEPIEYRIALTKLMQDLPDHRFVRISAKEAVNIDAVKSYSRKEVHLHGHAKPLAILNPDAYDKLTESMKGGN